MITLIDLPNTHGKEIKAGLIDRENPGSVIDILLFNEAASAADYNGAINVWKGNDSQIHCESMANYVVLEKRSFTSHNEVVRWTKKWLKKIGQRTT